MKVKTRGGVKEAKQLGFDGTTITVEALNPRSRPVKSLEMTIKRAVVLSEVISKHVHQVGPGRAAFVPLGRTGQKDADLVEIWGKHWRNHPEYRAWDITYDQWLTGALRRSIDDAMLNLPEASREKVAEMVRKRFKIEPEQETT